MSSNDTSPRLSLRCLITTSLTRTDLARDTALLDPKESARLGRFLAAEDRRDYAAAHALLRRMLTAAAPNVAPSQWRFERTSRGRPFLGGGLAGDPPIRFSLSHTRGLVACAVSCNGEVGVDVEGDSPSVDVELLMARVCSIDEQAQVCSAAPSSREEQFLDLWTLKEAYVKARGMGVAVALDQVSFDLRDPAAISASLPEKTAERWWLALIRASAEYRISVAIATDSGTSPILDAAIVDTDGADIPVYPVRASS